MKWTVKSGNSNKSKNCTLKLFILLITTQSLVFRSKQCYMVRLLSWTSTSTQISTTINVSHPLCGIVIIVITVLTKSDIDPFHSSGYLTVSTSELLIDIKGPCTWLLMYAEEREQCLGSTVHAGMRLPPAKTCWSTHDEQAAMPTPHTDSPWSDLEECWGSEASW